MSNPSRLERHLERIATALERQALPATGASCSPPPPGRALLWQGPAGFRVPRRLDAADPALLVGVERQRELLFENVRRFVAGAPAHDVLLWGDRGTGKSTLARGLLVGLADPDLALLAVPEGYLSDLPRILDLLEPDPRRWVLFCDDLSFAGAGDQYKEFKVLLEGGLEARPGNTLLLVTSNRRHLVPESFATEGEIHPEETVAEEISLADRFGLSLGFYPFNQAQYLEAVERHLGALGRGAPPEGWQPEALRWAMGRGIRSGRSALQAARDLAGRDRR